MRLLLNLFLILPFTFFSQTKELDFEYFLYGINECYFEYGNRDFKDDQVDIFFDSNKDYLIAEFLIKRIKEDTINYVTVKRINKGPNYITDREDGLSQYYLYSEYIKKGLSKYFGNDFLIQQEKKSIFKNIHQINSFITGAYLRDGEKINDTIYKIFGTASQKPGYCYSILKKSDSKNVVYQSTRNFNPINETYFNPSTELKKYFDLVKSIPNKDERIKLRVSEISDNRWKDTIAIKNKREKIIKRYEAIEADYKNYLIETYNKEIKIVKKLLFEKK